MKFRLNNLRNLKFCTCFIFLYYVMLCIENNKKKLKLLNLFKKFAYISLVKQLIIVERKSGACLCFILASV
jgi:hypothetical protein